MPIVAPVSTVGDYLTTVANLSSDPFIGKDATGKILAWNSHAEELFGFSHADAVRNSIPSLIPPDRKHEAELIRRAVRRGEKLVDFETHRIHKRGHRIPVLLNITPVRDTRGDVAGYSKTFRDITALHQLRTDLLDRDAMLRTILETASDALIMTDESGRIRLFSPSAEKLFGFTADHAIGRNVNILMPPPYRDSHHSHLTRYQITGKPHIIGVRRQAFARRRDGTTFPIALTIGETKLHDRRLFIGFIRDLTRQREVQQHLDELQAELIHSARLNELGHLVAALAHEVAQPVSAIFNYSNALARLAAAEGADALAQAAQGIEDETARTSQLARDIRRLAPRQAPAPPDGRRDLLEEIASFADQIAEALARYGNLLNRVLGSNTPETIATAAAGIAEQAERARLIVERIRTLARKGPMKAQVEDVRRIVEEVTAWAIDGIGSDQKLIIDIAADIPHIFVDRIQIEQVLLNLIRNAVEAMADAERRELTISAKRSGRMVEIRVADTGPGLPEEIRAHLFEPFVTTKTSGMGIGLSVCRTIIDAHGGEISVHEADGGGTAFVFTVPCEGM